MKRGWLETFFLERAMFNENFVLATATQQGHLNGKGIEEFLELPKRIMATSKNPKSWEKNKRCKQVGVHGGPREAPN